MHLSIPHKLTICEPQYLTVLLKVKERFLLRHIVVEGYEEEKGESAHTQRDSYVAVRNTVWVKNCTLFIFAITFCHMHSS